MVRKVSGADNAHVRGKGRDLAALARYLKELRGERGLSQEGLAARAEGVSKSHIALIETERLSAKREKVDAIADALEATTEEHEKLLRLAGHGAQPGMRSTADRIADFDRRLTKIEAAVAELRRRRRPGAAR